MDIREDMGIREAAGYVRRKSDLAPDVVLILGSGLGALADSVSNACVIETSDIPHYPASTVQGHRGRIVLGTFARRRVIVIQGRLHMYEGHPLSAVVFPVKLAHFLGAHSLFVTNAAGGINPGFPPGTLMWITDHMNWTGQSPTETGPVNGTGVDSDPASRIRRNASPYDAVWTEKARVASEKYGVSTREGTYLWTRGPSYETCAEIRAFGRIGADAVGMSTVPEVLEAERSGMSVTGLSTITNPAAGLGDSVLDHAEVLAIGMQVQTSLLSVARATVECAP